MKIYLAVPYMSDDINIIEERVRLVNEMAGKIMELGHTVFSPISHSHPISKTMETKDDAFWIKQDYSFIKWCDVLCIYQLTGWEESKGIKKETAYAMLLDKTVCNTEHIFKNNIYNWRNKYIKGVK